MNILLLTAHSIAEYDDVRMFTDLGHDVFSIGAYTKPHSPGDDKRPAILNARYHEDFENLCPDQMAAKEHIPETILDWADVIVVHHYPEKWIYSQWPRIGHKRVIWRTCGQSNPILEGMMRELARLRANPLQIVRYSPKEKPFFEQRGAFAGQDALIRFGKYPGDFPEWRGDHTYGTNVTQHMAQRAGFCGFEWYMEATRGLSMRPAGPGSMDLPGGVGPLPEADMYRHLAHASAYVYTGTLPASYTLGLIEALMVGVPVVSIGPSAFGVPGLFEGHELASSWHDDPVGARRDLAALLASPRVTETQTRARALFDMANVGPQWAEFLGG